MSKQRAFIRYTKAGNIVPGSLILTNGTYPNGPGLWKEITTDLCCENSNTMNYKVYTALLTQSGTNPPVAIVLENTLGGTPVWTRDSAGNYNATLSGVFTENKTFVTYTHDGNNGNTGFPGGARWDDDTVWLTFNDKDGVYIDIGSSAIDSVEIRVYP